MAGPFSLNDILNKVFNNATNRLEVSLDESITIGVVDVSDKPARDLGKVDVAGFDVALPAGTNAIGKLAANSGVDIGDVDVTSIAAGENHLGEVGGSIVTVTSTPTITTGSAYSDGDLIGTKMTLSNAVRVAAGSGIIQALVLSDLTAQDAAIAVVFFHTNPSNTTFTDDSALDIADADLVNILGVVAIEASDYEDFSDNSVATKYGIGLAFSVPSGRDIYACLLSDGATPTYVTVSDLKLAVAILQD